MSGKIGRQYQNIGKRILTEGKWVVSPRNGSRRLCIVNGEFHHDTSTGLIEVNTTRKSPFKLGVAELLGYMRGYTNAAQFEALGTKSWWNNAKNEYWLANGSAGEGDLGLVYGAVGNNWPILNYDGEGRLVKTGSINILKNIYESLLRGEDDFGLIWTFYNPGMTHLGCLRPCMYSHHFSLIDDTLHLHSNQRSADWPLGTVSNMVQTQVLLRLMAQITGHKSGDNWHKNVNCHLYENQLELFTEEMSRPVVHEMPELWINPEIKTLEDVLTWVTVDDFKLIGYESYDSIDYPFTT